MRTRFNKLTICCLLVALALSLTGSPVAAQDSMTHVCDSTLITLLYIAEHDYGFHSMSMDLATFDKGQYTPLFEAMMNDMMATEEAMMDNMMTEEAMMDDMGDVTMLASGAVSGEDPACTALREELDAFFYETFSHDMMEEGM